MEYLFEKDGKMKEKYISGTNIIPYCVEDVKKLMKEIEKDNDIEWNRTISPAICEIAYNFMQELTARSAMVGDRFQNCFDALDDLKRNTNTKFPQLAKQAEMLSSELLSIWKQEQQAKMKRNLRNNLKNEKIHQKPVKMEKTKKKSGKSCNKYQLKDKVVEINYQSDSDIVDQDIDELLNFLSQEEFSQT